MFHSTILDVAIGMIFVFLMLSLMCSAASEMIELMLKKRAIDLERGIRELLAPRTKSGTPDVVQDLYNHPMINGLFGGLYQESRIGKTFFRKLWRTKLPSYIPARSFALALMDLLAPAQPAVPSGAAGATPANYEVKLDTPPPPPSPPTTPGNPLAPFRTAVGASPLLNAQIRQTILALIDAAGSDAGKARENLESWFNNSMDRVSSWYKRRTQVTILILGMFVTVAVNADAIAIAKRLSTDRAVRESLVAAADKYVQAHATSPASTSSSISPTPCPSPTSEPPSCKVDLQLEACKHDKELQKTICACAVDVTSEECKLEEQIRKINACAPPNDRNSAECRYQATQLQLRGLGLPIGWDSSTDNKRQWPGGRFLGQAGWWDQIYWHLFGWLLTALAISLGAPFWFDLLNKFIVVRSAVKPHEKSPEEKSKD